MTTEEKIKKIYELLENQPYNVKITRKMITDYCGIKPASIDASLTMLPDIYEVEDGIYGLTDSHIFGPEPDRETEEKLYAVYFGELKQYEEKKNKEQELLIKSDPNDIGIEFLSDDYHSSDLITHRETRNLESKELFIVKDCIRCTVEIMTLWQINRVYRFSSKMIYNLLDSNRKYKGLMIESVINTEEAHFTYTDEEADLIGFGDREKAMQLKNKREEFHKLNLISNCKN